MRIELIRDADGVAKEVRINGEDITRYVAGMEVDYGGSGAYRPMVTIIFTPTIDFYDVRKGNPDA